MKRSIFQRSLPVSLLAIPLLALAACSDGGQTGSSSNTGGNGSGGEAGSGGNAGAGGSGGNAGAGGGGVCEPGTSDYCYSGPPGTELLGLCKAGLHTCLPDGSGYGPCVGEVVPTTETCSTMGDDDCDGMTNEDGPGCVCAQGQTQPCYPGPAGTMGVGACKEGMQTCLPDGTGFGVCEGAIVPTAETCLTDVDDDCDGSLNEDGAGCVCVPNTTTSCYTGPAGTQDVGDCKAGTKACNSQGTSYGPCIGEVLPMAESCAIVGDENCNGQINEASAGCVCAPNTSQSCYTGPAGTSGVGICKPGMQTCNAQGTAWGPCTGETLPMAENCAMPEDENCNGQANEAAAGCVCTPNTTSACYTGPMGTSGVGLCKPGTQACNAQGTGYGPCIGEVLPMVENCATPEDESCTGLVGDVCGNAIWTKGFGDSVADQDVWEVATDAQGNLIAVGTFTGTIDFGGGPLTTPNGVTDAFVVKLDPNGNHVWSKKFGANGVDAARSVAVDKQGNILVAGVFQSTVDFGGGPFVSVGGTSDVFVVKLSPSGAHIWSKAYGAAGGEEGSGVATDPQDNVIVVGHFRNTVDFGGGALTAAGLDDAFIVKLSSTGAHVWSKAYGDASAQQMRDVAADAQGNIVFGGYFEGTVDFGGGAFTMVGTSDGSLVKLSPQGAHIWSKAMAGTGSQVTENVAFDSAGNVIAVGNTGGAVDFGGGPIPVAGGNDAFLVKYSSAGVHQWSRLSGDGGDQVALGVTTDAQNNVLWTGRGGGNMDLGTGILAGAGGNDVFLAKYNAAGTPVWAKRGGDNLEQWSRAITTDAAGAAFIGGRYQGTIDLGTGPITSAGGYDALLAKIAP